MPKGIKSVGYEPPTSTDAILLGRGEIGCWCVYVGPMAEIFAGPFDTKEDAIEAAEKLPHEWSPGQPDTRVWIQNKD